MAAMGAFSRSLLVFWSCIVLPCACAAAPMTLHIYYESNCPFCKRFLGGTLAPIVRQGGWEDALRIDLVPYGLAQGPTMCQHGPAECEGNAIQLCAIEYYGRSSNNAVKFVTCMESELLKGIDNPTVLEPADVVEKCDKKNGARFLKCAHSSESTKYVYQAGNRTSEVIARVDEDSSASFQVPWVVVSEAPTYNIAGDLLGNLCPELARLDLTLSACPATQRNLMDLLI